jgi:hypothetical protein
MNCECTNDFLCKEGKRLWKLKGSKGRQAYSYHRMKALGLLNEIGKPKMDGESFWATNLKTT